MASSASRVTFAGSGDAFGTGGRFNTCLFVELGENRFFVDFGATSLTAVKAHGIAYTEIDTVLVTHLHADHGGGIPSLILEAMAVTRRTRPMTIAGPPGLTAWLRELQALMYPGSSKLRRDFELTVIEMEPLHTTAIGNLQVTPYPMVHVAETRPTGLRISAGGKTFAYTGDTEWNEQVLDLARGADLFVSECFTGSQRTAKHMSFADILENRHRLEVGKLLLTHLGPQMIQPPPDAIDLCANDGMTVYF